MELLQRQKQKRTKTREPFLHAQCTDNTSSITVHIKALPRCTFWERGLPVCVPWGWCTRFWRGPQAFSFFDISFPQASLCLSEAERLLCLVCIRDGNRWVPRESRARFALQQLGRSVAEPFISSSRAWRSPGRLTRFRSVSFPVLLSAKRKCCLPN